MSTLSANFVDFGQLEPEKDTDDAQLESVYSCDSVLDAADDGDDEDDDEPFDHRTKQYLDAHSQEMELLMANPMQQYADLKVAQVLSRGTLTARKQKRKLDGIKMGLPCHKIVTADFQEAKNLMNEINSLITFDDEPRSKSGIFNRILSLVRNNMNEHTVEWAKECEPSGSNLRIGRGKSDIVDVRQLVIDLVSSSSEEEVDTNGGGSSEDERIDFIPLRKIEFLLPGKEEERLFTPSFEGLKTDTAPNAVQKSNVYRSQVQHSSTFQKLIGRTASSCGEYEEKCSTILSPEGVKIFKKKMIIVYKELIFRILNYHVIVLSRNRNLMKHKLFQIWLSRQIDGINKMRRDIERRKLRLLHRTQKIRKQAEYNDTEHDQDEKWKKESNTTPEIHNARNRRWEKTIECMREREKLLIDKQGSHFIAGFLNERSRIKTEGVLTKVWPETPSTLSVPPAPPRTSKKILKIFGELIESKHPVMTYGDLLRIMEADTSLIMEGQLEEEPEETKLTPPTLSSRDTLNAEYAVRPTCREWYELMRKDSDIESPFVTKRELKNYIKMLDEKFFPDPNFRVVEELVSIDQNALISQAPRLMKIHCSLDDVEASSKFYRGKLKCAQSRGVYFFQYKPEWTPKDVQAAYEKYISENRGFEDGPHEHLSGCLLIYKNVNLAIVMIEGQVDNLFYHFAGFRNSSLYKFIDVGRVLYVSERVSCFLNQWVSIVTEPPPGDITYFTESKKVLFRVAEPRVHHFRRKMHDLYSYLASEVNKKSPEKEKAIPSSIKSQMDPCRCLKSELDEENFEYKLPDQDKHMSSEMDYSALDLLPPPALVSYLLKYKKLKTIVRFIDEFVMQPEIESEDEKYNIVEDAVLSNYIDSDDEKDKPKLIREVKRACKEREIITKCQQELMDALDKEDIGGEKPPWAQSYDTSMFSPKLAKVQVRKKGEAANHYNLIPLVDSDDEVKKTEEVEQYILWSHERDEITAQRKFLNFLDAGTELWQKKVKRFGLTGRQVKRIMRDAKKYKQLRRILRIQDEMESMQQEVSVEGEEANLIQQQQQQSKGDMEVDRESRASLLPDSMDEIEKLLTELEGEGYEICDDENVEWPYLTRFEEMGEFVERFGEGKIVGDIPVLEWDGELDRAQPLSPEVYQRTIHTQMGSSETGESVTENTSRFADEETIPEAPPATSVTDTSTDP